MILLLDNHDSFVHNLARYIRRLGRTTDVIRSHEIDVPRCRQLEPAAIVISPGPKGPDDAGCSIDIVKQLGISTPILGVCLGHQVIGAAFGGNVTRCEGMHGMASEIDHDGTGLFRGCRQPMKVGRYHSLAVEERSLPSDLIVTARTRAEQGPPVVMGLRHRVWPVYGVQFHPESVLSEDGADVMANFLRLVDQWHHGVKKCAS